MLCPECGAEYVEDVVYCADCNVALVEALPVFAGNGEPLRMIRRAGPIEAPMIEELLTNNGIESVLQGAAAAAALPASGGISEVRVWVRASEAKHADELIDAHFGEGVYEEDDEEDEEAYDGEDDEDYDEEDEEDDEYDDEDDEDEEEDDEEGE